MLAIQISETSYLNAAFIVWMERTEPGSLTLCWIPGDSPDWIEGENPGQFIQATTLEGALADAAYITLSLSAHTVAMIQVTESKYFNAAVIVSIERDDPSGPLKLYLGDACRANQFVSTVEVEDADLITRAIRAFVGKTASFQAPLA